MGALAQMTAVIDRYGCTIDEAWAVMDLMRDGYPGEQALAMVRLDAAMRTQQDDFVLGEVLT